MVRSMHPEKAKRLTLLEKEGAFVGLLLTLGANSAVSSDHILSSSEATECGVPLMTGDAKGSYGAVPNASMMSDIIDAGISGDSDRGDRTSGLLGGAFGVVAVFGLSGVCGGGVDARGDIGLVNDRDSVACGVIASIGPKEGSGSISLCRD